MKPRAFLTALAVTLLTLAASAARAASAPAPGPFSNWAAIVVAGDFHAAHTNQPTEAFDNARRDVSVALEKVGFSPANLREFSVRPDR